MQILIVTALAVVALATEAPSYAAKAAYASPAYPAAYAKSYEYVSLFYPDGGKYRFNLTDVFALSDERPRCRSTLATP